MVQLDSTRDVSVSDWRRPRYCANHLSVYRRADGNWRRTCCLWLERTPLAPDLSFCAVASEYPNKCADNHTMGFRFRRSIKLVPGIRLNFGKRGISTSIGVRGAHVTFGNSGTRTTVGLPGSGLSYTHLERPRPGVPIARAAEPVTHPGEPQGNASRGFLWIGLIVIAVVVAIGRVTSPAPPAQAPTPARTLAQTAAQAAAQAADDERLAEANRAALGVTQIRHVVANPSTLRLSRVTVMPKGTICYEFHLQIAAVSCTSGPQ
jgi:hypothetical protein